MAKELSLGYYNNGYNTKPSTFLNSIFMSTVNVAARTLVSVASGSRAQHMQKWRTSDHLRFMVMLITWLTLWVLRVLMDHIPFSIAPSSPFHLLQQFSPTGLIGFPQSSSPSSSSSMDLIVYDGVDALPVQALGRSLSHILALLNEIPATSRKYQFAMAMAERIMDENARSGHVDMIQVNRLALSSAFSRTSTLLHRSLMRTQNDNEEDGGSTWMSRAIRAIPMGTYVAPYLKGIRMCLGAVRSCMEMATSCWQKQGRKMVRVGGGDHQGEEEMAEKLAEEMVWISIKLRDYEALDEAMVQWSLASSLASLSLYANPRVQGLILKISGIIFKDINGRESIEIITKQEKFRLLMLWLPLLCHASNGVAYPVLTYLEKVEIERAIDKAIWSLAPMDQEVILTNWLQDFAISPSEWPNLQPSYDRWCQSTRNLVA
ncbi:uncharacterized protein LOC125423526 [Ziziphus jujuba]|uniref:Uncharacterized protein LOC125423526 n=2 Tax=Ziziphus jujuba TaxID=326968 RepID=A0ABM3IRF8_ZIZJJ|nr:uncharacterized protein LOC125423526 [Ziziphus jujuba]KAH7521167.1 hypothetical protein FEM48_Zijuj07G0004600 [Ziziphus jujuba var. spinosa]